MHLGNQDFIWISLQMPCLVFSMSLLSFFLKNPRGKLLRSLQALGPPSRSVAVGTASKPHLKAGQVFSARFFGTTKISLTNGENPTQNDPKLKNSCVKQFFSYNHFISFYLFCVADSSTHIQNISGLLPRATLIIYPPLRDSHEMTCALSSGRRLFRTFAKAVGLEKASQAVETTVFQNLNCLNQDSYRLQIWHVLPVEHDILSNFGNFM